MECHVAGPVKFGGDVERVGFECRGDVRIVHRKLELNREAFGQRLNVIVGSYHFAADGEVLGLDLGSPGCRCLEGEDGGFIVAFGEAIDVRSEGWADGCVAVCCIAFVRLRDRPDIDRVVTGMTRQKAE